MMTGSDVVRPSFQLEADNLNADSVSASRGDAAYLGDRVADSPVGGAPAY